MIAKSEFSDVISMVAKQIVIQAKGFSVKQVLEFLEMMFMSEDINFPLIVLAQSGEYVFVYADSHTETINEKNFQDLIDYSEFEKSGVIEKSGKDNKIRTK